MKRDWKTTIFGILSLSLAGFQIYTNPTSATNPEVMSAVAAGIGLILAKDSAAAPAAPTK